MDGEEPGMKKDAMHSGMPSALNSHQSEAAHAQQPADSKVFHHKGTPEVQSDPRGAAYYPPDPVVSKDGSYAIVPYGDEAQAQSGGRRAVRNAPPPPPHYYSGPSFDSGALNLIQMSTSTTERLVRHMEAKIDKIYANVESQVGHSRLSTSATADTSAVDGDALIKQLTAALNGGNDARAEVLKLKEQHSQLQAKLQIQLEKNQKYVTDVIELREKLSSHLESVAEKGEQQRTHATEVAKLQEELNNAKAAADAKAAVADVASRELEEQTSKTKLLELELTNAHANIERLEKAVAAAAELAKESEEQKRARSASSAQHASLESELRSQISELETAVKSKEAEMKLKLSDAEEKIAALQEKAASQPAQEEKSSASNADGRVKLVVQEIMSDTYKSAKAVFSPGAQYDGKSILKQIKGLLKNATKVALRK